MVVRFANALDSRGEDVALPPLLVVQWTADCNIRHEFPQRFAESYARAGDHADTKRSPACRISSRASPAPKPTVPSTSCAHS